MAQATRTRPGLGAALSSVRGNRPFQLLWWSNLFFFGGAWGQTLVLGWIAYDLTRSEFLVAVFTAVKLAPLLLGPLTGALADRYHRVKMLIIASGWAFVAVGVVAAVLLVTLAANILLWPIFQSFMPVFARELLGLDAAGLGTLLAAGGVGGLVGSVIMAGLGDFRFKGALFVVGTASWAALWVLFAASQTFGVSMLLMFGIGAFGSAFAVLQTTLLLITTEPELHGRALGLQELAIGIMPVSALVIGAIAQQVGVAATTVCCGVLLIIAVVLMTVRVPELLRISGHDEPRSGRDRCPDAPGPVR